ncbi:transposase [Sorangium sp. So ce1335]
MPRVDELSDWIRELHPKLVPNTPLYVATQYALNQEEVSRRCFTDGQFEIDNGVMNQSIGFSPAAVTRTRTCPGPACGAGTSRISRTSGPPKESSRTARLLLVTNCRRPWRCGAGWTCSATGSRPRTACSTHCWR